MMGSEIIPAPTRRRQKPGSFAIRDHIGSASARERTGRCHDSRPFAPIRLSLEGGGRIDPIAPAIPCDQIVIGQGVLSFCPGRRRTLTVVDMIQSAVATTATPAAANANLVHNNDPQFNGEAIEVSLVLDVGSRTRKRVSSMALATLLIDEGNGGEDHAATDSEAELVRAGDLNGQLGDPLYPGNLNGPRPSTASSWQSSITADGSPRSHATEIERGRHPIAVLVAGRAAVRAHRLACPALAHPVD